MSSTQLGCTNGVANINHWADDVTLSLFDFNDEGICIVELNGVEAAELALELIRRSNGLDDGQMAKIREVVPIARAQDIEATALAAVEAAGRRAAVEALYAPFWTNGRAPIFECHDGWLGILAGLLPDLVAADPVVRIGQVKEKFGSLRVYVDAEVERVSVLIAAAERVSAVTCEICGDSGVTGQLNGWWSVRCGACEPDGWEPAAGDAEPSPAM